jgi:glycosyltransferase involved in cell wall biosynthesis
MLSRCLASLVSQQVNRSEVYPRIVVVSNGPNQAGTADVIAAFRAKSQFPMHIVSDKIPGIARARNRACATAIAHGADWIAFIDDDEVAAVDWLMRLMHPFFLDFPVLMGRRIWRYPSPRPFWAPEDKPSRLEIEGGGARVLTTANVRFSADLITQGGLSFDEAMGLAGGSDQRFFNDARRAGYAAHATNLAVTYEYAHRSRLTYRFMVWRHYAHLASLTAHEIRAGGRWEGARRIPRALLGVPVGLVELAIAPIAWLAGRRRFKQFALRGGKRFAVAAGTIAATLGHLPQTYARIHGE